MIKINADLHNHFTTISRVLNPNQVADRVYKTLGENSVCALVNYEDRRYEAFSKKAEPIATNLGNAMHFKDRNVTIVKGEEVNTKNGDLLILGLNEGVHPDHHKELEETLEYGSSGIIIAPHPFYRNELGDEIWDKPGRYMEKFDAIEIHNNNATKVSNKSARLLFEIYLSLSHPFNRVSPGKIASSDGHSFEEVGTSYTTFYQKLNLDISDSSNFNESLKYTIRNSNRELHKNYHLKGKLTHMAILAPLKAASKFGIELSKGDKAALRK